VDIAAEIKSLVFIGLSLMALLSGGMILFFENLIYSAVALFFTLLGVAGLYILLGAPFLGMAQIMVYAGGVLVLIIFGIFLTSPYVEKELSFKRHMSFWITSIMGLVVFQFLVRMILRTPWQVFTTENNAPTSAKDIGHLLLTKYLLPFEIISVVLLFVLIGSVLIVRKDLSKS